MVKNQKNLFLLLGFVLVIVPLYLWFVKTPQFVEFTTWSQQNFYLFFSLLTIIKIIGIVFPPLPGGLLTLGAIPVIGWQYAYLADLLGLSLGSSIAYFIGKRYGYGLLHKLFDDSAIEKIRKIKVVKKREIETVFMLRAFLGSAITEIVCYAAGILNIRYRNFLIGSTLSHIVMGIPFYYFANSLFSKKQIVVNLILMGIVLPLLWKFRSRYIE